uniref:Uncharacterized protein n=1 Tax=Leersia perrieri TaxID=77586 RepID=A0A0D9XL92_9ORYZ
MIGAARSAGSPAVAGDRKGVREGRGGARQGRLRQVTGEEHGELARSAAKTATAVSGDRRGTGRRRRREQNMDHVYVVSICV